MATARLDDAERTRFMPGVNSQLPTRRYIYYLTPEVCAET